MISRKFQIVVPFFLFFILFTAYGSNNFFFWDTINLVAAPATFFYENNFRSFILPAQIDTGHVPLLAMYIAKIWQFFGKSLEVAHFAMLPFLLGIVYQVYVLAKRFIGTSYVLVLTMLMMLIDPTFLSQAAMISPDTVLLFCFLLALNAVFENRKTLLMLALIGLFLISMRGIVAAFAIFLIDFIFSLRRQHFRGFPLHLLLMKSLFYAFPFLLFIAYHFYHYKATGWFWSHPDSAWEEGRIANDFNGALYNIGIFAWRILDFGRVLVVLTLLVMAIIYRKKLLRESTSLQLLILIIVSVFIFIIPFLYYQQLTGHRYLLPLYLLILLAAGYYINKVITSSVVKKSIFGVLMVSLLIGNFWVYPNKIAQGWDASLAHLPFYNLQLEMNNYLEANYIPYHEVGTAFPILGNHAIIFMEEDIRSFKPKNIGKDKYILYSNVFNGFSDAELDALYSSYKPIYELYSPTVFIQLFERK